MKKLLKVVAGILIFLVAVIGIMAIFKISPPPGPWPQPPWSKYAPGNQATDVMKSLPEYDQVKETMTGSDWKNPEEIQQKIVTGHVFMDLFSDDYYNSHFDQTIASMKSNGAQWVIFDNYWSYSSLEPPKLSPLYASEEQLSQMIQKTHAQGQKFALMIELNWDIMRGEWKGWEEQQKFWDESAGFLDQMGNQLVNPTAETNQFWDQWFEAYTECVLWHARIAEEDGADLLVIGKQLNGAVRQGNEERWDKLIEETRKVYHGPISYAAYTNNDYSQLEDAPFLADLDVLILYLYNELSGEADPSIPALKDSFEAVFSKQAEKYAAESGKKVILLTPFQSRDHGAKQVWFEPAAEAPEVTRDLLIQAKLYEAMFQALEDEPWVDSVWTWGYWWLENNFDRSSSEKAAFDKSSSVRNKPAAEVILKWSQN